MNNKIIIGVIVVIVLALGIFFLVRKPAGQSTEVAGTTTASTETKTQEATPPQSLKSLLALGQSKKCTFSDTSDKVTSQGTVYVSGGQFRGDFNSTIDGKQQASHMISDGKVSYMWMDGMPNGYKMAFDATATDGQKSPTTSRQSVDPNKNMDYKCESWSADSSMFVTPASIKFQDMSAMMQDKLPTPSAGAKMDVSACAALSEPAKTACINAMTGK